MAEDAYIKTEPKDFAFESGADELDPKKATYTEDWKNLTARERNSESNNTKAKEPIELAAAGSSSPFYYHYSDY